MQHLTLDSKFNIYKIWNIYQLYARVDLGFFKIYSLIKNRKDILLHNRNSFISFNELNDIFSDFDGSNSYFVP